MDSTNKASDDEWSSHSSSLTNMTLFSQVILNKTGDGEIYEINLEEELEETNLSTLISNSKLQLFADSKCQIKYEIKDSSKFQNIKHKNYSVFIEEKTNHNDLDRKYRIEPTLDFNDFNSNPPNFSKNQTFPELIDNELNAEQNNC